MSGQFLQNSNYLRGAPGFILGQSRGWAVFLLWSPVLPGLIAKRYGLLQGRQIHRSRLLSGAAAGRGRGLDDRLIVFDLQSEWDGFLPFLECKDGGYFQHVS